MMNSVRQNRIFAVIRKEIIQILRDPRTLSVVLLQPIMMLFLYGYGVTSDIYNVDLGVVDWSKTQDSREFIDRLTASGYFRIAYVTDRYDDLGHAIDARRAAIGVVIPRDFSRLITRGDSAPVQVLVEGTNPSASLTASSYIQSIAGTYATDRILALAQRRGQGGRPRGVPPIDLRLRVWFNEDLNSVTFIVPGLIVVILMSTSALLTSGAIARERERGTLEQLVASPIRPYELMIGKIFTFTMLSYVNAIIVMLVGTLWFGIPFRGSLILLLFCAGLFLMSVLGIGLYVSSITTSQRTAQMIVQIVTGMPSMLLSGFYFPISSMPPAVQAITTLVPARYFMVIVRGIFLKGAGVADLWTQILPLAAFGLIPLTASIFAFKKRL